MPPKADPAARLRKLERIAWARGGALLSSRYVNGRTKVRLRCDEGHEWKAAPEKLLAGQWCPTCGSRRGPEARRRYAIQRLEEILEHRGGQMLSPYAGSQTKVRFRCAYGHEWDAVPNAIQQGEWCRRCAIAANTLARKAEVFARLGRIAIGRGGAVLSGVFEGARIPMRFRCAAGHVWSTAPTNVIQGSWCPECASTRHEIDTMHDVARQRGGQCLSTDYAGVAAKLRWRCAAGHEWSALPAAILRGGWCRRCRGTPRQDLGRMRELAQQRGGACLSATYEGAQVKLQWRCRAGHGWEAAPADVVKGHWCPTCGNRGTRPRLTIGDMKATAEMRGGACLSETYVNSKTKLRWQCASGHEWNALPSRVRQGTWCPFCAYLVRGTLDGMRAYAERHGGRCLSRSWNDHSKPLRFACARGHRFELLGKVVKTGVWCPACAPTHSKRSEA